MSMSNILSTFKKYFLLDIDVPYGVKNYGNYLQANATSIAENESSTLTCGLSNLKYYKIVWKHDDINVEETEFIKIQTWKSNHSIWSNLTIINAMVSHSGRYECEGMSQSGYSANLTLNFEVRHIEKPIIEESDNQHVHFDVAVGEPITLKCGLSVTGYPEPKIGTYLCDYVNIMKFILIQKYLSIV